MSERESIESVLKSIEKHFIKDFVSTKAISLRIHRIHDYLEQDLRHILSDYALQSADFSVLATLRRSPEPYCLSPTELYNSMLFSSGGLTKVLNRVTNAGLVERVENPDDKRSKLVKLTQQGQALIEEVATRFDSHESNSIDVLDEQEQQQLRHLLSKLLGRWEG